MKWLRLEYFPIWRSILLRHLRNKVRYGVLFPLSVGLRDESANPTYHYQLAQEIQAKDDEVDSKRAHVKLNQWVCLGGV